MLLEKVAGRLPIAAMLHAGAPALAPHHVAENGIATSDPIHVSLHGGRRSQVSPDLITSFVARTYGHTSSTFSRPVSQHRKWDEKTAKRFDALVEKEAFGELSADEFRDLDSLQRLRRVSVAPSSGEEIIRRHQREKFEQDMLNVLRRHVRVDPLPHSP